MLYRRSGPRLLLGTLLVVLGAIAACLTGCAPRFTRVDSRLANRARLAIGSGDTAPAFAWTQDDRDDHRYWEPSHPRERDERREREDGERARKSVVVAELLAIFPGMFVHGLGHYYAEDYESARKIRNMGEWGYLLTAIGGGLIVGAVFLDDSSDEILPISLYAAGGGTAAVGLAYFFTAWFSDMWDTPRAIRTGGRPWSFLQESSPFGD
jgi:hypothetical protein